MARQKKQYRPIAGQKWWEKVLDWVTRDENDKYPIIFLALYLLLLIISAYITSNIMENFALSDRIFYAWNLGFPPLVVIAFINPLFGLWGLKKCFTLQLPIKDHITQHGPCSYDELVSRFMPFKIHLGIDDALDSLVNSRDLICDGDLYRLPSPEDRQRWFDEWFEDYGEEYTFGLLEDIFSLDLRRFDCGITIQFYTRSGSDFWISKEEDETSGQVHYQVILPQDNTISFETFQALANAPIFDCQTLREVWSERVVLTYINDEDIDWWIERYLH